MEHSDTEELTDPCKTMDGETTGSDVGRGTTVASVVRAAGVLPEDETHSDRLPSFFPTDEPVVNSIEEPVEESEASSSGSVRSRIEAFEGMSETLSERNLKEESRKKKTTSSDPVGKLKVPTAFSTFVPGSMAHGSGGPSLLTAALHTTSMIGAQNVPSPTGNAMVGTSSLPSQSLVTFHGGIKKPNRVGYEPQPGPDSTWVKVDGVFKRVVRPQFDESAAVRIWINPDWNLSLDWTYSMMKSLGVAVCKVLHFKVFIVVVLMKQELTEGLVSAQNGKSFSLLPCVRGNVKLDWERVVVNKFGNPVGVNNVARETHPVQYT